MHRSLAILVATLLLFGGCGSSVSANYCGPLSTAVITPGPAIADHMVAAPGNQVQFSVASSAPNGRQDSGSCAFSQICQGAPMWTSSDPVNAPISNAAGSVGVATCVGTTAVPVTITASFYCGRPVYTGETTMTCR